MGKLHNILYAIIAGYNLDYLFLLKFLLKKKPNKVFKFFLLAAYNRKLNYFSGYIGYNATIGDNLRLPHGLFCIFISDYASIGSGCTIYQGVTIGSNDILESKNYGAPIIDDNCYIGAGAKIIGSVKIGRNVRIGANCVVTTDVPDNSTVVMETARVIMKAKPVD
jgi:serine O-acetyltransferase